MTVNIDEQEYLFVLVEEAVHEWLESLSIGELYKKKFWYEIDLN